MTVTLHGAGSGDPGTCTLAGYAALERADLVVGASRLLDSLPLSSSATKLPLTSPREIAEKLCLGGWERPAVVFSGDLGFWSGARVLLPLLAERGLEVTLYPGLSSVQMFAALLRRPWQDWRFFSAHGASCDAVHAVMGGPGPAFFLTSGSNGPAALCRQLMEAGLGELPVSVGENLALPGERVLQGTAAAFAGQTFAPLNVLLAEAAPPMPRRTPGWPDGLFQRGKVPMTKQMVRSAILALLNPASREVCWDVGAGTGSVSIELAACCRQVWAVERKDEACELILRNREALHAWNLRLVRGTAPQALADLPAPDAVFVGGSGGQLPKILDSVLAKNPGARLCVSAIALETLQTALESFARLGLEPQVRQIAVSATKTVGKLHLLEAGNPIFLLAGNCP